MFKYYYRVTKPGILYGNLVTVAGGFFLGSHAVHKDFDPALFLWTLVGISLTIAGSCVFNNIIDRDIDALMERTKNRELVLGVITPRHAFVYGLTLSIFGAAVLFFFTNLLTLFVALIGVFFYVVCYSLYAKRGSVFGTLVGSVSGAVPPLVGYLSITQTLDVGAVILFIILAIWQMPHSYAIAIYRLDDYRKAKIPVLPVARGMLRTKIETLVYTLLFACAMLALYSFGYVGKTYIALMGAASLAWILLAVQGFFTESDHKWAKQMFTVSILIITLFSLAISLP